MALPKRKHSNARTNKRRANWKLTLPSLTQCSNCKAMILTHNACHKCGYYQGRHVDMSIKEDEKKKREGRQR
jgi:large subunit ribosomal protein L32